MKGIYARPRFAAGWSKARRGGAEKGVESMRFGKDAGESKQENRDMPYRDIVYALEETTGVVTLSRPERRNALSMGLMRELIACFGEIERDRRVRAVILGAAGKVFSAGHDLTEMRGCTEQAYRETFEVCTALMGKIQSMRQPVIAQVQGMATAAGCQLVASCDLAVASEGAQFATPGVRIGLFCSTPMVALTRAIGRKRAFEMLATGAPIDARKAESWGLVNRVVAADQLESETRVLAGRIAEASGFVMELGKSAFYTQVDLDQQRAYSFAKDVMTRNALAADAQEGITAFIEKRQPVWKER